MVAEKLTVVQILPELEEGGVEGETVDLAVHLAREGHRSIVISAGGRLVERLEEEGCLHLTWPGIGKKSFGCLPYIARLRKFFRGEKIDIVHLRSRLPAWIGWLAWRSLPEKQRPSLVTTFHGYYSINSYSAVMTKGEAVVAVSAAIRDHILEHYRPKTEKIHLIHGGFSPAEFDPEQVDAGRVEKLRERWNLQGDRRPVVMLPGRHTPWKGQEVMIEAMTLLKEDAVCLLVGEMDEKNSYTRRLREQIVNGGLEDRVRLVGHCSDMPAACMLADVIVSTSTLPEAFGKVALEGMAMARPVIATAHGGALETVVDKETGVLVPPGDAARLAEALAAILGDAERARQYGVKGRQRALRQFTNEAMFAATLNLYRELRRQKLSRLSPQSLTVMQLLPELNSGGVERGTLEVGRHLAAHGNTSIVVSGGGRLVPQLEREGSRHFRMKIGSKSPLALLLIPSLRRLIVEQQVDILHLRSRMPAWVGRLAWLTLRPSRRPVLVTTFHGFYSVNAYSAVMTKGDGVIAVSRSIHRHIAERYGRKEGVRLIFRGVDQEHFSPHNVAPERVEALRTQWQLVPGLPVVALPGRLTRLKGQEFFIRALSRLNDSDFQAVIIGDTGDNPGYTAELRTLIDSCGLGERVKMVGYCADMPAAFLLADIVVSSSSSEPEAFGRTTAEAMSMGCPVVVTAHGGSLETVIPGENGWLVEPADSEGLSSALREALSTLRDDPAAMAALGERNRQRVKRYFSADAMCRQTETFYRQLLAERFRPQ